MVCRLRRGAAGGCAPQPAAPACHDRGCAEISREILTEAGCRFLRARGFIFAAILARARKNPHAVALGRLGCKKGGPVRAAKLTAEERIESARKAGIASGKARLTSLTVKQRSAIARKAAFARWDSGGGAGEERSSSRRHVK